MKISFYFIKTYKFFNLNFKKLINKFLYKSNLLNKISSGIYIYMPICINIINKIKFLIKLEIEKLNFLEIYLPIIQPSYLWKISKRIYNNDLNIFFIKDKKKREYILSPTHEEIISYFYKNFFLNFNDNFDFKFFQINFKFRDELRTSLNLVRTKEFLMKDAYYLTNNIFKYKKNYENIYNLYIYIFNKFNINFKIILCKKNNSMGSYYSHEFYYIKKYNNFFLKNIIYNKFNYLNILKIFIILKNKIFLNFFLKIYVNNISDFYLFSNYLKIKICFFYKTIILVSNFMNNKLFFSFLILKFNILINFFLLKFNKFVNFKLLNYNQLKIFFNKNINYINFLKLNFNYKIFIDSSIKKLNNFIFLSNYNGLIILNIFKKNTKIFLKKNVLKKRGIEIAHIFQLNNIYSNLYKIKKFKKNFFMNCYGIGITRLFYCLADQNKDKLGFLWPDIISPFKLIIIPINYNKSNTVRIFSNKIYNEIIKYINEILLDDRNERIGVLFNDWNLLGIKHKIIISEKNLKIKKIEYNYRKFSFNIFLNLKYLNFFLKKILNVNS